MVNCSPVLGDRAALNMWDSREAVLASGEATLHTLLCRALAAAALLSSLGSTSGKICENAEMRFVRCCKNHVLQVMLGGAPYVRCGDGGKRQPVE